MATAEPGLIAARAEQDPRNQAASAPWHADSAPERRTLGPRREKLISHALSRVLRREAHRHGLPMSTDGYVPLLDLVTADPFWQNQVTPDEVKEAIRINAKGRYQLHQESGIESVRALQGHSQDLARHYHIDDSAMLRRLSEQTAPATAIHGTFLKHYSNIRSQGLFRGRRQHIHLINGDLPTDHTQTRPALRHEAEIMLWVDLRRSIHDGFVFFESNNQVLLTPAATGGCRLTTSSRSR